MENLDLLEGWPLVRGISDTIIEFVLRDSGHIRGVAIYRGPLYYAFHEVGNFVILGFSFCKTDLCSRLSIFSIYCSYRALEKLSSKSKSPVHRHIYTALLWDVLRLDHGG